jgi:hypothetical protein
MKTSIPSLNYLFAHFPHALCWLLLLRYAKGAGSLAGQAVAPMGYGLSSLEIKFNVGKNMEIFTIQSHGLLRSIDEGSFKVEGPLECVNYVSLSPVIVSGPVRVTAAAEDGFFHLGDTIVCAVTD